MITLDEELNKKEENCEAQQGELGKIPNLKPANKAKPTNFRCNLLLDCVDDVQNLQVHQTNSDSKTKDSFKTKLEETELCKLRTKILQFNEAYEAGHPLVCDYIYDFYKKKLGVLERFDSLKISENIGCNKVDQTYQHLFKILSLEHNFEDVRYFIDKISKTVDPFPICCELKIDGVSVVARYNEGVLHSIATRGDGVFGQDVSHLKGYIKIPDKIPLTSLLDLRFECYFNKNIIENPRNAASGVLLKKEIDKNLIHLNVAPHNLYSKADLFETYHKLRDLFKKMGLNCIEPYRLCNSVEEIEEYFATIALQRDQLDFEVDGIVIKVDSRAKQVLLGNTAKAPKYAYAIKFSNSYAATEIKNIEFNVTKTGKIMPVAIIDEVIIKGRKITKATLNNLNDLRKKEYGIGDVVKVEMSGDVIPKITKIIEKNGKCNIPSECPSCGALLKSDICVLGWDCNGQKLQRLCLFAEGIGMNGVGEKQIDFFMRSGVLNRPCDFFSLEKNINKIKSNPSWLGETSFTNLIEIIKISSYTTSKIFYASLGLPSIGRTKAQLLEDAFPVLMDFINAEEDELLFLGETISKNVYEYKEKEKDWIIKTAACIKIGEKYQKNIGITLFEEF